MGRPLNKKYFGNRNIGAQGYDFTQDPSAQVTNRADDFIGGEGVASLTLDGSEGQGTYTNTVPTVTFSAPSIPGGVTALAGDVHVFAKAGVVDTVGSGYHYNDTIKLSPDGTWTGTEMAFTVTALQTVGVTVNNGGSANDNGDEFEFSGSYSGGYWAQALRVRVTNAITGVVQAGGITVVTPGIWVGATAPTTTAGATRTQVAAGQDYNGVGLVLNLTSWGVSAVSVAQAGDHTAVPGNVSTSCATTVSPAGGTGAKLFVQYGVSSVDIAEKGSGYISTSDAQPTFSSADIWTAYGFAVLTTDSGSRTGYGDLNASTNQENALLVYANTDGEGGAQVGDIQKQANARSYKIRTVNGTAICKLVDTVIPGINECFLVATDSDGYEYYVMKLTAHKALLTEKSGGGQFSTGQSVKWTFDSAELNSSVRIDNA